MNVYPRFASSAFFASILAFTIVRISSELAPAGTVIIDSPGSPKNPAISFISAKL